MTLRQLIRECKCYIKSEPLKVSSRTWGRWIDETYLEWHKKYVDGWDRFFKEIMRLNLLAKKKKKR